MGKHYGNAGGVESTAPIHGNNALLNESCEIAAVGIFVLPLVPFKLETWAQMAQVEAAYGGVMRSDRTVQ